MNVAQLAEVKQQLDAGKLPTDLEVVKEMLEAYEALERLKKKAGDLRGSIAVLDETLEEFE